MTRTVVIEQTNIVATEQNQGDVEYVIVQPQPNTVAVSVPETSILEVSRSEVPNVQINLDDTTVVEVERIIENTVVIEQPVPTIVEVVTRGPQGIPGDIGGGGNAIAILGYPVQLVDGQEDDLLSFTGSAWRNKPQEKVTDGGNF